jgi:hypothetical protein
MIKEYVANGQAVAFSGHVLCGYGTDLQLQLVLCRRRAARSIRPSKS